MNSRLASLLALAIVLTGCETMEMKDRKSSRLALDEAIRSEPPGDYFIGRRYYKQDYKFWGWVRRPGQAWSTAKLVMMNEQTKLAPDREQGKLGSDNNTEYKLIGELSTEPVYEPASNNFYPEFMLKGYEVRSVAPASIFKVSGATDPARRVIAHPY
jgi:hypothetical protein